MTTRTSFHGNILVPHKGDPVDATPIETINLYTERAVSKSPSPVRPTRKASDISFLAKKPTGQKPVYYQSLANFKRQFAADQQLAKTQPNVTLNDAWKKVNAKESYIKLL